MDDAEIVAEIGRLVAEEHGIERAHVGVGLSTGELEHLRNLEIALDQCWDLLAQRRARRAAGQDADAAHIRPSSVVEHYEQ